MNRSLVLLTIIGMIILSADTLQAQVTLKTTDEVYVKGGVDRYNNFVSDTVLRVRSSSTSGDVLRRTYLKFDLRSYTGTVGSVELKMTVDRAVNDSNATPPPYALDRADFFTVAEDGWTESTLTYKLSDSLYPRTTYLFSQQFQRRETGSPDSTYSWDVTAYVQSELGGDSIVSFCLIDTIKPTRTNLYLISRRAAYVGDAEAPVLVIFPSTGISPGAVLQPKDCNLAQNYPNPFNPSTRIRYDMLTREHVRLEVYDVLGQRVATLVNETQNPGSHFAVFNPGRLSSGIYFYSLSAGRFHGVKRMVLLK